MMQLFFQTIGSHDPLNLHYGLFLVCYTALPLILPDISSGLHFQNQFAQFPAATALLTYDLMHNSLWAVFDVLFGCMHPLFMAAVIRPFLYKLDHLYRFLFVIHCKLDCKVLTVHYAMLLILVIFWFLAIRLVKRLWGWATCIFQFVHLLLFNASLS